MFARHVSESRYLVDAALNVLLVCKSRIDGHYQYVIDYREYFI